ncbi:MAG: InlB B-repeat-containing protein [Oscillospiraceae bacterium]
MKKRILSILLMCCMVLTLLPVTALAEDSAYTVGEDTSVSARALAGTAGTKLKADNIDAYVANGLGSGVYTLAEDVTISGTLRVTGEATVDLNGYVLRYAEEAEPGSIFRVTGGKTLTMTDSRPAATHEDAKLPAGGLITGGKGFKYDNGAGQSYNYYGGGVYVETGASFVLAGGTIYACGVQSGANQAFGGGIYAEGGSVTMTGGAIRNCAVSADYSASGGAIYAKAGSVTMTSGVISGCSAMYGGGISASGCTVQITGGRIENCKASEHGGGLFVSGHTNGPVSVLDAAISGCEAKRGGGVALIAFAELELGENARITGCTATEKDDTEAGAIEYGAAIYMDLESIYTVNHPGCFLYANGGRVEGTVYVGTNKIGTKNNYLDSVKATNAIDHTDGKPTTVFTGDVSCEGDIRGGIFHGSVTVLDPRGDMADVSQYDYWKFCSNLSGGSFYKPVRTECHVSGGTFYGGLTLEKNAKLSGKPMNTGSELTDKTNIPNPNGKPVTVTYKYGELGGTYATQIVQAGETAKTPAEPTREGYTFIGWDKAIPATMPAENITITARWKDIEKPTGEIIIGTDKWQEFLNKLTSGLFFKDAQEVTINAADNSGTVFISYLVTDQDLSEEELKSLVYRGYEEPFRIEPNGEYIVYVMLVDASLNITYLRSDRLTLDNVQPVISGVENGKTYCGARTVTITEKYIDTVTVNGTTVELDESDSFRLAPANGGQKIIVADKAGNTTEMTVTVNDGHTYGEWASNGDGTHTRKCTVDGCAGSETKDCSGGKATCRDKAKCAACGKTYGELDAENHADLKHIPAKAATWVAEGNIEYWYCEGCGRYFSDRDGTKEIRRADTVTAKRKSSSAAAKPEDDPKSPGTGDTSNLALWIALLFASGGAAIGTTVVSRKKYNR